MRLVPRLYEELFQIHEEKTDKPSFKMVKRLEETLHKEDIQMAGEKKKTYGKVIISLAIREYKLKARWGITTQVPEWLKFKWLTIPSVDKYVEKPELSYTNGEYKLVQTLWNLFSSVY